MTLDYERLCSNHLENPVKDGNYLHARCRFCKRPAFVVRLYDGAWHCRACKRRGSWQQFEESINSRDVNISPTTGAAQSLLKEGGSQEKPDSRNETQTTKPSTITTSSPGSQPVAQKRKAGEPTRLSKPVRARKLRKLSPRHYQILVRYLMGQSQRQIAGEMGIGEQWLSVIVNSVVFQKVVEKWVQDREQMAMVVLSYPSRRPSV